MLNLPPQPGTTGVLLLLAGAIAGAVAAALAQRRTDLADDRLVRLLLAGALGLTVAGAPFTVWRVLVDVRETAPISAEHARYVGAETKLIDGELVERIGAGIPEGASYYVAVAPGSYEEIRVSLDEWMGYALAPRPQTDDPRSAAWIVTWGARPEQLGMPTGRTRIVGRNRLVDREPVYLTERAG